MKKMFLLSMLVVAFFSLAAQPPTISSFTPTSGPVGTTVTITGTNFSINPAENIVYFGTVKAPVVSSSPTFLIVTAPAGATYHPMTVTTNGLTAYGYLPFIVTAPDCINARSLNQAFVPVKTYDISYGMQDVAAADLNGDGKPDLLAGSQPPSGLSIFKNTSNPGLITFDDSIFVTSAPIMTVGDLDGDGLLDLATTNGFSTPSRGFWYLHNKSTTAEISFAPFEFVNFPNWDGPPAITNVALGDLDEDGRPDAVAAKYPYGGVPEAGILAVMKNTSSVGNITFETGLVLTPKDVSSYVAIGDLNGDQKPEIVLSNYASNTISVFRNTTTNGVMSFGSRQDFAAGEKPTTIALGDLDNDGRLDIAVINDDANSVTVFKNASSVSTINLVKVSDYPTGDNSVPLNIRYVGISDMQGDGLPDIIVGDGIFPNTSTNGHLAFGPKVQIAPRGQKASATDWDGDGLLDLAVSYSDYNGVDKLTVYRNQTCITAGLPTFLADERIVLQPSCAANDGQISIIPTSGTPPFRYSIDGGNTYVQGPDRGYTFTNLSAGVYHLRLKDAYDVESDVVGKDLFSSQIKLDYFTTTNASCGASNGTIDIVTKCGDAPYHLRISGRNEEVVSESGNFHLTQLPAGLYTISITDAVGTPIVGPSPLQVGTFEVTVNAENCPGTCVNPPAFLNNQQIVLDASCNRSDGQISLIPTTGMAPFLYSVDGGTTYMQGLNVGHTFTNLAPGLYQLRIKDSNGCESEIVSKVVGHLPDCSANQNMLTEQSQRNGKQTLSPKVPAIQVIAYPNPNNGKFWIQLNQFGAERVQVQILDSRGAVLQTRTVNAAETNTVDVNLSGKAKGLYLIRVVSDKNIQQLKVLLQ
jgi:hypothetical protein